MLFNSFNFIIFFVITVCLYYVFPYKAGIYMLLAASYIFYMCWSPKLIVIIVFVTFINYVSAIFIYNQNNSAKRKFYLIVCLVINFGLLFVFKYMGLVFESLNYLLLCLGIEKTFVPPDIVLPMGISFYTFQAAGYTIDVYMKRLKPSKNYVKFSLFVTFFPQLVAGPIERSKNLIKQFNSKNKFRIKNVVDGIEIMAIGFFKKIVIADRISIGVNTVFNNVGAYSGLYYILAMLMFTVQIYCDFSGYSDIARGAAKVMGFRLMVNFNRPFGAKTIKEFWRRWHISLSTWFMDYVYIPLGGNRKGILRKYINLFTTFIISGLWHGAAYTFILWGALHGIYIVCEDIVRTEYKKIQELYEKNAIISFINRTIPVISCFLTFGFVVFAFSFFRANSLGDIEYMLSHLFYDFRKWFTAQYIYELVTSIGFNLYEFKILILAVLVLFVSEALTDNISGYMRKKGFVVEVLYYSFIAVFILTTGVFYDAGEFIYFQF